MSDPAVWNNNYGQNAPYPQDGSQAGIVRGNDPAKILTSAFATNRMADAIIVFDLIGMVTSLVAKTPYFQSRLSGITPGTHYMLVLLQLGYNAQQMDYLNTHGDYVGAGPYCGAKMLQQGGGSGGVMMLYAPLPELPQGESTPAFNSPDQLPGKQAYINPTPYIAPVGYHSPTFSGQEVQNQTFQQSMNQGQYNPQAQQHTNYHAVPNNAQNPVAHQQSVPSGQPAVYNNLPQPAATNPHQQYVNANSQIGYDAPRQQQAIYAPDNPEPRPTAQPVYGNTTNAGNAAMDAQALIDAAVKAALSEQAQRFAAQSRFNQPENASANDVQPAHFSQPIQHEASTPQPSAFSQHPIIEVTTSEHEIIESAVMETLIDQPDATHIVPSHENTTAKSGVNRVAHPFALADDMPNSFVIHPVGPQAKGQFVWQHRNQDLHIIAYGLCLPTQPDQDNSEALNILQNALHTVVVQLGNAEADDIMLGVNDVYQSKINGASELAKSAYVEVSVCILNHKIKVIDLAGTPYGSFFLRNGTVSGIQNGRIAALATQMIINKQDLRCARFRTEELDAIYLFGMGSIVRGNDITNASKTHNQITLMLESVMKMSFEDQYEAMKNHLTMLVGAAGAVPVLIGLKS